jgi:hypothetical protein
MSIGEGSTHKRWQGNIMAYKETLCSCGEVIKWGEDSHIKDRHCKLCNAVIQNPYYEEFFKSIKPSEFRACKCGNCGNERVVPNTYKSSMVLCTKCHKHTTNPFWKRKTVDIICGRCGHQWKASRGQRVFVCSKCFSPMPNENVMPELKAKVEARKKQDDGFELTWDLLLELAKEN